MLPKVDNRSAKGGYWYCRVRQNEAERRHYATAHGKARKALTAWRTTIKRNFGIGEPEYLHMFNEQAGRCAICGTHQDDLSLRLAVDHDHGTGVVRGLLCTQCNLGLAKYERCLLYKDTLDQYLAKHQRTGGRAGRK